MRTLLSAVLLLSLAVVVAADPHHQTGTMINGSTNPEQIPDTVILRLWLDMHTHNGQIKSFSDARLTSVDTTALTSIMKSYRSQLDALRNPYNEAVESGGSYDRTAYWDARISLINTTWAAIQTNLSSVGFAQFKTYLESKKAGAQVSPNDPGLGAEAKRNLDETKMVASMAGMVPQADTMTPNYSALVEVVTISNSMSDNFERANGGLGSNWTTLSGAFSIASDNVNVSSGGSGGTAWAYYNVSGSSSTDQCSSMLLGNLPSEYQALGVAIRINTSQPFPSGTFYTAAFYNAGTWSGINVQKVVNGGVTELGSHGYSMATNDLLTFCGRGTSLTVIVNNTQAMNISDSSITSGAPGILGTAGSATGITWSSGNYGGAQVIGEVEGDTICSEGCPNATHTPSITNKDSNGNGGTSTGDGVPPADQIEFEYGVNYPQTDVDGNSDITVSGNVVCSVLGLFFLDTLLPEVPIHAQFEDAFTYLKNESAQNASQPWTVTNYCSEASTPPDNDPPNSKFYVPSAAWYPEFASVAFCERLIMGSLTIGWVCERDWTTNPPATGGGFYPGIYWLVEPLGTLETPAPDCTNWNAGKWPPDGQGWHWSD
jgi:hypothetical protein